ncbi:alkaline phosphatase family protein [Agromyces mediolanus]|uniref:alkaline phosphatase family protein n=1 Tax=Agromyces mediolanus TaxID=41986 RepID=UPI00203EC75C|nr:nucleotide pyrophosphatase/phosphodiesterase family protein [Agromyces mediolanus]MCM3659087.1 alkaline phosphatase family protein [Agromyces mediolanus]
MLPVTDDTTPRLAGVLASSLAAVTGGGGAFGLPHVRSAIVLLVDGLGATNLQGRSGHARFLAGRMAKRDVIRTVFPSTTAAAIASFATGVMPGEHGLVGYRVLEPSRDVLANQLNGWEHGQLPADWQRHPTLFQRAAELGVRPVAVGAPRYAASGYTRAVLQGAEYRSGTGLAERFAEALDAVGAAEPSLVYLYVPELDQIAHAHGWESGRWLAALEELDAEASALAARLPRDVGLLVTADHGVIDVPEHRHVHIDARPALLDGVRHVGGEPRCLALWFDPSFPEAERERVAELWRDAESKRAWVFTRDEAIAAGLYGGRVDEAVRPRIGDLLVAARAGIAYYDAREANRAPERMIGQHGSMTDEETRVPLIRLGAFAR